MPENQTISILHLEDNPLDAELTCEMLTGAGTKCVLKRVVRLEEFRQALADYSSKPDIDLILADYNMPGFDGFTALEMTRQVDMDIPFILLSGALGEELAVELLRNGATDYVLKNNLQRLPLVVSRAIEEHKVLLREKISQNEVAKARDEAQKANSAKGRFLGRISHELRTPLNAIIGYTQLMQSDPMSEEQQHCTAQILKAGEHLLQLINEVLDITRIESGVIPITASPNQITPLIERAVDLVRPMAREANVLLHIDGGPCMLYAHVDKDRLTQALINLISNAIKYNHPNGHVYVECQEERPGFLKVIVRDTGMGIPPAKMERLFTPFDRLDLEKESAIPGTGLGLTVSKALVEAMGGTLGVLSSENEGSIFWVEVPSIDADQVDNAAADFNHHMSAKLYNSQCQVLIVENHPPTADFLERTFRRRGMTKVCIAHSVEEALENLSRQVSEIIVTELEFPGQSGEELLKFICSHPQMAGNPVIIITKNVVPDREKELLAIGAFACLEKPFKVDSFFETISAACKIASSN